MKSSVEKTVTDNEPFLNNDGSEVGELGMDLRLGVADVVNSDDQTEIRILGVKELITQNENLD